MRRWWVAYGICVSVVFLGFATSLLGRDQFTGIDEQRRALLERGQAVTATVTYVEPGAVAYEYWFAGRKHYGSSNPGAPSAGLAVGRQIEVKVLPDDLDISTFHPERQPSTHSVIHDVGRWIGIAGLAALLITASLDARQRKGWWADRKMSE